MPPMTLPQMRRELESLKELAAAKRAADTEQRPEMTVARSIAFVLASAARSIGTPAQMSRAKSIHFALFGTPEIDRKVWGPQDHAPIVTISQECNKLGPVIEADAIRWGY